MAKESFENEYVAQMLNERFISIKVDKEERPDIDSIYMEACQAFTGSGGWPMSIFLTPDQKPFYAGTYYPTHTRLGMIGFIDLLISISGQWKINRARIDKSCDEVLSIISGRSNIRSVKITKDLVHECFEQLKMTYDKTYGGFGTAPKFPMPHNLLFLMDYAEAEDNKEALSMAEKTLQQMYKGGIFDHIGYGFSRYSTDAMWLVPHFEKMLCDNALMILAYVRAYEITGNAFYKDVAVKTLKYCICELKGKDGGFCSAQDADCNGVEGKFYAIEPGEIIGILGEEDGELFNRCFDVTYKGNFDGKNIPNLLKTEEIPEMDNLIKKICEYRKMRADLHTDDKILASWNALMIAALAESFRVLGDFEYLRLAEDVVWFMDNKLYINNMMRTAYRDKKTSDTGFLDDNAFYIYANIKLYDATLNSKYSDRAKGLMNMVIDEFYDPVGFGFFQTGKSGEQLVLRPKETYDGATPSGNSIMTYNLIRLAHLGLDEFEDSVERQLEFMSGYAKKYPTGHCCLMSSALRYLSPERNFICVGGKCGV